MPLSKKTRPTKLKLTIKSPDGSEGQKLHDDHRHMSKQPPPRSSTYVETTPTTIIDMMSKILQKIQELDIWKGKNIFDFLQMI